MIAPGLGWGPAWGADGSVTFRLWAPSVAAVALELNGTAHPMQPAADGWFAVATPARAGDTYRFGLPDGLTVPDPASRAQAGDVHDASVLVDPAYAWQTEGWCNRPWHEAVIYEVHPGLAGGFDGIRRMLPDLAALGVTAVELMPVADFPGRHNWGYDGVLPFAPDAAYGTPAQLKALIDAAHALGLMVLLDVVYNHFGPDGAYLHVYAKPFFDPSIHTPWGAAIDFARDEVQSFFIDNALMWLEEYRFDGLRFDATHAIAPQSFLPNLAAALRARVSHPVHLVLEHEGNRASLLGPGRFDAQWSDDWHHCVHVLLTGEHEGYYGGFQQPAAQLARAMREGFVFQGENGGRGEPSAHLPSSAFVICLQNHDQVGNRAMGERLASLAHPAALRAATVLLLLSPFVPLIFMGEEIGTAQPFLFFTDHNPELAALVREGRRREFAHFSAFHDMARRDAIPDPNAAATFAASHPESDADVSERTRALYRQLLQLRRAIVTPGIPGCASDGAAAIGTHAIWAAWRLGCGTRLVLAANLGRETVAFAAPAKPVFATGALGPSQLPGYTAAAFHSPA